MTAKPIMSSSLARSRSLRKPTQGSSTDLPPTATTTTTATAPAPAAPAPDSTAKAPATTSAQRPGSPSRLPAPRPPAASRPTTRSVSGASVANTTGSADAAAAAAKKKNKSNPVSTLFRRNPPTAPTRQKDAAAAAGGPVGSGPPSAPPSRTSALAGLSRTSSAREPGLKRTRYPPNASTSNLAQYSSSSSTTTTTTGAGTRSSTTARPTTSGGLGASRPPGSAASSVASSPTKGHARARSVATLNGSTVLRPPGQPSAGPAPARARPTSLYGAPPASMSTTTTTTTTARPRPPSATDRLSSKAPISSLSSATTTTATAASTRPTRTASTSVAPKPPAKPAQPPQLPRQHQASPTSPPRHHPPRGAAASLRPAFNTLQQHYSPAKSLAPKPLTATYLAPPSPSKLPTNVALTAETARLQAELLQLHLLHRDLPQTTAAWHASARTALAARHADLGKSSADLARLEAEAAERLNVAALRRWAQSSPSTPATLEDKIQRLDALLASLWSLDTPGGKHSRLVRAFERWASALPDLEAARARAENAADPSAMLDADSQVRYGGGLDARWKDEAAALVRKLEGWDAQLREMAYTETQGAEGDDGGGDSGDGEKTRVSSLKRMLDGCGSLVRDMLDELAVMDEIETAAMERETEWIRRMNREGDDGCGKDTQRAGAVWRVI